MFGFSKIPIRTLKHFYFAKELEVKIRVFPEGDEPFEIEIIEMDEEILDEDISDEDLALQKPKHRSQCVDGYRPCPWVSCRYNLFFGHLELLERVFDHG